MVQNCFKANKRGNQIVFCKNYNFFIQSDGYFYFKILVDGVEKTSLKDGTNITFSNVKVFATQITTDRLPAASLVEIKKFNACNLGKH